jgi:hypothetical protein
LAGAIGRDAIQIDTIVLARLHQSRRQVDDITDDGVFAAIGGPDWPGEYFTGG